MNVNFKGIIATNTEETYKKICKLTQEAGKELFGPHTVGFSTEKVQEPSTTKEYIFFNPGIEQRVFEKAQAQGLDVERTNKTAGYFQDKNGV